MIIHTLPWKHYFNRDLDLVFILDADNNVILATKSENDSIVQNIIYVLNISSRLRNSFMGGLKTYMDIKGVVTREELIYGLRGLIDKYIEIKEDLNNLKCIGDLLENTIENIIIRPRRLKELNKTCYDYAKKAFEKIKGQSLENQRDLLDEFSKTTFNLNFKNNKVSISVSKETIYTDELTQSIREDIAFVIRNILNRGIEKFITEFGNENQKKWLSDNTEEVYL